MLRPIVNELKYLEDVGIEIGQNRRIKGTLTSVCSDNLGANTCLGFIGSFNSLAYSCRICECISADAKKLCEEVESKIRNKEKYSKQLEIISKSEKIDYMKTQA